MILGLYGEHAQTRNNGADSLFFFSSFFLQVDRLIIQVAAEIQRILHADLPTSSIL